MLNNRYKIFRKLAHGYYATLWLAKDLVNNNYVAVKVHSAKDKLRIPLKKDHPNVERLLDHFVHDGVNGKQVCTVFEPLGRSLRGVLCEALDVKFESEEYPRTLGKYAKYYPRQWTLNLAREICRQVLVALDVLHSQGIAHRDVHPGNIAFALAFDINSMSMDEVQQRGAWYSDTNESEDDEDWDKKNIRKLEGDIMPVKRLDKEPLGPNEIQYIVVASRIHDRTVFDDMPPFRAVLIDLDDSRPFDDCDQPLIQPSNYRPPESILPIPITHKADIFSAGIMLYEIVTTRDIV